MFKRWLAVAVLVAAFGTWWSYFVAKQKELAKNKADRAQLQAEVDAVDAEILALRDRIAAYETDPRAFKKEMHNMGYVEPGEIVFEILP